MRLVLVHPEIPQNVGTLLRAAACLEFGVDLVEPLGFLWSNRYLRRAGMDYLDQADYQKHASFEFYWAQKPLETRTIALVPQATKSYLDVDYHPDDHLWVGCESSGFPPHIQTQATLEVQIPMKGQCRSLNMASAAMVVMGEALRQTKHLP
ncbi:MAG: tRNA (cytidine(34)-2'-O)-methyltransferase [Alphaproteobacteria bacterium]